MSATHSSLMDSGMTDIFHIAIFSDSSMVRHRVATHLSVIIDVRIRDMGACSEDAFERIRALQPHLVVIDADAREACALNLLDQIQEANTNEEWSHPMHVMLISHFTPRVVPMLTKALDRGHFDHILAPDDPTEELTLQLIEHVAATSVSVVARYRGQSPSRLIRRDAPHEELPPTIKRKIPHDQIEVFLIGSSTGGPQALSALLPALSSQTNLPILVVQHIQQSFTLPLAQSLDGKCAARVKEAEHEEPIRPGHIYIAPGGNHLGVYHQENGYVMRLNDKGPQMGCRPSVNFLFRSAAAVYGPTALGVILTGMGNDGTEGALALKKSGGMVFAQDESSSVVWGMPGSAVAAGAVDEIYPLDMLATELALAARHEKGV